MSNPIGYKINHILLYFNVVDYHHRSFNKERKGKNNNNSKNGIMVCVRRRRRQYPWPHGSVLFRMLLLFVSQLYVPFVLLLVLIRSSTPDMKSDALFSATSTIERLIKMVGKWRGKEKIPNDFPEERPGFRGSDLLYEYGKFVLIYHSILNTFGSDL